MIGVVIVLVFPLILGMYLGLIYTICHMFYGPKGCQKLNDFAFFLYTSCLGIVFVIILTISGIDKVATMMGLNCPVILGVPKIDLGISLLAGMVTGIVFFYSELYICSYLQKTDNRIFANNKSLKTNQLIFIISFFVVFVEEFLWRGYLIYALPKLSFSLPAALIISSVVFGLNHYYFGVFHILFKSLLGLLWGTMYILTSSLLLPLVSHYTFNCLYFRQDNKHRC